MPQGPESQLAYLGFKLITPSLQLRPYIGSYWQIKTANPLGGYHEEFMHPTGGYGIVFNLGESVRLDGQLIAAPVFLDGANTVSRKMGFSGRHDLIGIRFHEGGAFPFLGLPLNELRNEAGLLDALKDPGLVDLHSRIQEVDSLPDRVELLERWLLGRLALGNERHPLIPASLSMLQRKGWSLPIPELAEEMAVGQRHLERLYQSQVGMSPKQYAQLLRVDSARRILRQKGEVNTTRIGVDLGFFDQSHFTREFKAVVGMTPHAYWKRKK